MRSWHSRLWAGAAWTLLCAVTGARAVDTTSIYEVYMSIILAVGGLLLGATIVVLVMCCSWEAATLRLQSRERRMWETSPASDDGAKLLEKLNDEADAARRRKPKKAAGEKGQSASTALSNNGDNVSAESRRTKERNAPSPGATAVSPSGYSAGANPYAHTEDDVVAFDYSLPGKGSYP